MKAIKKILSPQSDQLVDPRKLRRKPTLDPNWGPSVIIGFRGSVDLKKAIVRHAEKYGLTYSKYLRALVIQAVTK